MASESSQVLGGFLDKSLEEIEYSEARNSPDRALVRRDLLNAISALADEHLSQHLVLRHRLFTMGVNKKLTPARDAYLEYMDAVTRDYELYRDQVFADQMSAEREAIRRIAREEFLRLDLTAEQEADVWRMLGD